MNTLQITVRAMTEKGLLAMDESISTCNKRFAALNISRTELMRINYRELLATTPVLDDCISGAILSDETIHQQQTLGKVFVEILEEAGIIPGIKVDMGAKAIAGFPDEKITEGLDGLRDRLKEYKKTGRPFCKMEGRHPDRRYYSVRRVYCCKCTCAFPLCRSLPGN